MTNILITGKNSYIGIAVSDYLQQWPDKYNVTTIDVHGFEYLSSSTGSTSGASEGSKGEDGETAEDWSGYHTVFHVAGIAHVDVSPNSASDEVKSKYYTINTDLTEAVARKAKDDGVSQFIFMSSMIVYGDSAPIGVPKMITADTEPQPANFYGDSKLQAERKLKCLGNPEFRVCILWPPMIYGRGSKGNFPQLVKMSKLPFFPKVKNQRSMLYITNLCEFVRLMIENEESGLFFPQNGGYSCTSKLVSEMARIRGKKIVMIPCTCLLKLLGRMIPIVNKAFGNLTYDSKMSKYRSSYQVVGIKDSIREIIE